MEGETTEDREDTETADDAVSAPPVYPVAPKQPIGVFPPSRFRYGGASGGESIKAVYPS